MRIGFMGAHGTGKTTTAKRLSELTGWPMVPSTARLSKAAGFGINRDATPDSQLFTMMARTSLEDKVFRQSGNVISDRTPLDSLAYTLYQLEVVWPTGNEFYWEMSYEHVLSHMQKYDLVVYFPILWEPKSDGIRDTDTEYQKDFDDILRRLAKELEIEYTELPDGTVDFRAGLLYGLLTSVC